MHKIAIVLAFSESCYELCRQCIATCWRAATLSNPEGEYHFFCYECNFSLVTGKATPFKRPVDLQNDIPIDAKIIQRDASQLQWIRGLPDIVVYHDFAMHDMDNFDYVLFCHDDVYFKRFNLFDDLVYTINRPSFDIIAEPALACNNDLSLRFHPSMIFVRTDKFRRANLSFINEKQIFVPDSRRYSIEIDGGAELFASFYSKDNPSNGMPCSKFPSTWYKHLRINSDYGIEMHNLISPNDPKVRDVLSRSKKYTDYYLYGKNSDQ